MSVGGRCRAARCCSSGQASTSDGGDPAAPAGDDGAAVRVAGDAPDDGLEHPAAVERQPGHQVEHADEQVGAGEALDGHQQQARRASTNHSAERGRADRERGERPDDGDPELLARACAASPSIAVTPPRKCSVIERDREAVALGHSACDASCSSTER